MYCSECGGEIADDSRFCRHCGAAQTLDTTTTEMPPAPVSSVQDPSGPAATKPINNAGRTIGIILAVLLGLALLGSITNGSSKSPEASAAENSADMMASTLEAQADRLEAMADNVAASAQVEAKPEAPVDHWSYSTDEDKVRGATTYYARTTSTNQVYQSAPYGGGTTMTMTVRKHPAWGTDVILTISEGQMMCPSYEGCSGMVRFDNGPAQRVSFSGPQDNSSETVFVDGARSFVAKLKKAKKVTIEKTLYQAGAPQFEFDVSGLKWSH